MQSSVRATSFPESAKAEAIKALGNLQHSPRCAPWTTRRGSRTRMMRRHACAADVADELRRECVQRPGLMFSLGTVVRTRWHAARPVVRTFAGRTICGGRGPRGPYQDRQTEVGKPGSQDGDHTTDLRLHSSRVGQCRRGSAHAAGHAHDGDAGLVGEFEDFLAFDHDDIAGGECEAAGAGRGHHLDGHGPDGGDI